MFHLEVLAIQPQGLLHAGHLAKVGGHLGQPPSDSLQAVIRQRLSDHIADGTDHHPVVPGIPRPWHRALHEQQQFRQQPDLAMVCTPG